MNQRKVKNDGGDLFLNIFRNIFLKKEIFNQMKLLDKHYHYYLKSLKELNEIKFKEYISEITFNDYFNDDNINEESFLKNNNNNNNWNDLIIKSIKFGNSFNKIFYLTNFSTSLITIDLGGNSFNQKLSNQNMLPKSLKSLTLGDKFNQELIPFTSLPLGLKYLKIGNSFNQLIEIGSLPNDLEVLILGDSFNKLINSNSIPSKLKVLELGLQWNQFLLNQEFKLLKSIEKLKFKGFNQSIYDEKQRVSLLPPNLKELRFQCNFNKSIYVGVLPQGLEVLELGQHFSQQIYKGSLPYSLKSLDLGKSYYYPIGHNVLPCNLESIKFSPCSLQDVVFPKNLKSVSIGYYFKSLHLIGESVETLEVDKVLHGIPSTIKNLKFSSNFNNIIDFAISIPLTIQSLDTGNTFNQPLKNSFISNSITNLTYGDSFNQPIDKGAISNSNIKHLKFGISFKYPLNGDHLPCKLETLTLSKNYPKNNLNNISKFIKINFI